MTNSTIGEIASLLQTGKTPPSKIEEYFTKTYNWYTPGDISNTKYLNSSVRHISELAVKDRKASLYPENSLLITCIGDIGRVGISKEACASNQQITAIKPIKKVNVNFLYYWFLKHQKVLNHKANNAVVPILNNRSLKEIPFNYPPLKTQEHIAGILDDADALRDKTKQLLEEYDNLAQSIFLDMFGDPVTNSRNWEFQQVNDIAEIVRGSSPRPKGDPRYFDGNVPRLMVADVTRDGFYVTPKIDSLTELGATKSRPMKKGDLVMAVSGRPGATAILNVDCCIHDGFAGFREVSSEYIKIFLCYYFQFYISQISMRSVGAIFKNITTNDIRELRVPKITKGLQNEFAEKIALIEQQKDLARQELKESEDLFNCLLQKAFKGELVPESQEA